MNQAFPVLKNTAVLGLARLIERATSIVLALVAARILHAAGLGIFSAAMVVYEIIITLAEMGATNLLMREVGKDFNNTNRYVVHLGVMSAALSLALTILFWIGLPYLQYSGELATAMLVMSAAILPGTLNVLLEGIFVARQRVEFVTYLTLISSLLNLGIGVYLLLAGYGIISVLVAFVLVQWVMLGGYLLLVQGFLTRLRFEFDFGFALALMREMKSFAALSILAAIFSRPEVVLLSILSNPAQVGFYSAALKVVTLWQYIPRIYLTNVYPVLARAYHVGDPNAQRIESNSYKYLLAISLPLAAGIFSAARPIVEILYGAGFESSVMLLQILALNIPLAAVMAVFWRVLFARGKQSAVLVAMLIVTTLELAAGYLLIQHWAAFGAALIVPVISLLYVGLLAYSLQRDGMRLDLWALGWRLGAAAIGMGVMMYALVNKVPIWMLVPFAIVSYVVLLILLRAFSADEVAFLRGIWRARQARANL